MKSIAKLLMVCLSLMLGGPVSLAAEGSSDGSPRIASPHSTGSHDKPGHPLKDAGPSRDDLVEMVRRAQETADEARDEARRVRADYETLLTQMKEMRAALNRTEGPVSVQPLVESAGQSQAPLLSERLARTEEQVEIHTAQIKEQAQTKVESESKFNVKLSGMILFNSFYNSDGIQRVEPLTALQRPPGSSGGTFGSTFRQTRLALAIGGPRVAGARLSAEIDFDFYGGTIGQVEGDVLGALRIRTASARLDWTRTSITVGQEAPIISPRNPTSLAAVWFPALSGAGNLWQWRPSASIEHRFRVGESGRLVVQGSVLPPFGESYLGVSLRGTPSYESRLAWRRSLDTEKSIEIGVGGHYGRRDLYFNRKVDDFIVSSDWLIPFGSRFEFSGEFYHGRAVGLGEQSGGRIDRIYSYNGPIDNPRTAVRGVRSSGGWAQLTVTAWSALEFNFAYGQEDPNNSDIRFGIPSATARYKNQVTSANFIYQLKPTFLVSLEYRRLWTDYSSARARTDHYGAAVAYVF